MKPVSQEQIKAIHAALNSAGMMDHKRAIVASATNGRTESTREMTFTEAKAMLQALNEPGSDPGDRMRKKIIGICHDMAWYLPGTKKIDFKRIDDFLLSKHGTGKRLNDMNTAELNQAVTAFQGLRSYKLTRP